MDQREIEALADAIHLRMAKAVLQLPPEFKELALGNYIMPPVQIPMRSRNDNYFLLRIRVDAGYNMVFQLVNMFGELLKEWVMES